MLHTRNVLTGSSALQSTEVQQSQSPRIEAKLTAGNYRFRSPIGKIGTSHQLNYYGAVEYFNGQWVIAGGTPGGYLTTMSHGHGLWTFDSTGNSLVSYAELQPGYSALNLYDVDNIVVNFYSEGDTIAAFYTDVERENVYRVVSSDGRTWGGTELMYTGTCLSRVFDIAAVGYSCVYTARINGNSPQYPLQVDYLEEVGSTIWDAREISKIGYFSAADRPFLGIGVNNPRLLTAYRNGDFDYIFYSSLKGTRFANPGKDAWHQMGSAISDGVNWFDDYILFRSPTYKREGYTQTIDFGPDFDMTNVCVGNSFAYIGIFVYGNASFRETLPVWGSKVHHYLMYKMPIGTQNYSVGKETDTLTSSEGRATLYAGSSYNDLQFIIFSKGSAAQSGGFDQVYFGSTSVDISSRISNYENQNNERIKLTVGNYE